MTFTINMPMEFPGTAEEKKKNFDTHWFVTFDREDYVCCQCDCKPGTITSYWPCGDIPPRIEKTYEE